MINWKTDQKTLFRTQHREVRLNMQKSHRWEPEMVSWEFKQSSTREKREWERQSTSKRQWPRIFPAMMKDLQPQIQKALQILSRISTQKEIHMEIYHCTSAKLQRQREKV